MILQNIKIVNSKILYSILFEIKAYLPFTLSYHEKELQLTKDEDLKNENSIIVVNNNFELNTLKIDKRQIFVMNNQPVRINKLVNDLNISLYPNPTNTGYVNITSINNGVINARVFDILGKKVIDVSIENNRLDVNQLKTGIYIIKMTQGTNSTTKKLVIE